MHPDLSAEEAPAKSSKNGLVKSFISIFLIINYRYKYTIF